jgi:hypothetical protein
MKWMKSAKSNFSAFLTIHNSCESRVRYMN